MKSSKHLPKYAEDLGLLLIHRDTRRYMIHSTFLRAIKNRHVVILKDENGGIIPALDERFSMEYEVVSLDKIRGITA
jgi:hypothetical protein